MRDVCKILSWPCSHSCEQAENRDETRLAARGNECRVDFCKGFAKRAILCCSLIAFYPSFAEKITFENGLDGWSTSGDISWSANSAYTGSKTAKAAVAQKTGGKKGLLKSSTALAPECDNITVSLEVYNEFVASSKNHQLQIVASTNNWKGSFLVGDPIYVYNELATNETGEVLQWWKTEPQVAYVPGASQDIPLCIGLQAIAAPGSGKDIYVREVDVEYKASATPSRVRFCDATGSEVLPIPGDAPFLAVDVRALPPDDVHVSKVVISSLRGDDVGLYGATNIPGTSVWISSNQVAKVYDAGETIILSARVEYSSDHFETLGKGGVEEIAAKDCLSYVIPRRGSVWINEIGRKEGGEWFIEIVGATNRCLTSGWTVEVVGAGEHNVLFTDAFDFDTFTNGVGFQVFEWANPPRAGSYTLKLLNSSGICESSAIVDFTLAEGESFGKIGYLPFIENWDYQDAETKLDWTAYAVSSTPGVVNDQEGFNVPISGEIEVYTYRFDEGMEKAVPSALVTVTNSFTGEGNKKETLNSDAAGVAVFGFEGTHCNATFLPLGVESKAFGWSSSPTNGQWCSGDRVKMQLDSSVGFEPFDDDLWKSYMKLSGDIRWNHSTTYGSASADVSQKGSGKQAIASTQVPFFTRGKRVAQYQMRVKNVSGGSKKDKAWAEVSANGSVWWTTPSVINNYEGQTSDVWNSLLTYTEIPESITASDNLSFSLVGEAGGNSGKTLYVDDIRLAFQDSVEVSELAVVTNMVKEGQTAAAFSAVVSPLATEAGVKNVSVDFMLKVKDGSKVMEFAVPCDWSNAVTVAGGVAYEGSGQTNALVEAMRFTATTNDVSAALAAAGGGKYLGTGATIEYYVCAHYYADSNDPDKSKEWEERYYPDNHQVDDSGAWYVIGDYNPVTTNMSITGPGLSFRSDPTVRSDGFTFDFRAFSSAGDIVSNGVTVAGVTTTFVAGGKTKVLDSTFTLDGGLTANTSYTVTLIYWTENGQMVTRDMEVTTLGTASAPTLVDRTADSLTVKADGCKAASMAIACNGSTQWIAYGASATFNGLEADCEYEVTVVAVRNLAGVETETSAVAKFYTLPNAPTDNVTETPRWDSHTISVANLTNDTFGAFGNPSNTVYAFYVESVNNEGAVVATNWLGETKGGIEEVTEPMPKWLTLAEWDQKDFRLSRTATETNNLYLVSGGRQIIPGGHESVNDFEPTTPSPKRLVKISLFAETVGEAERVAYDPAQHEATYGLVTMTNRVMSPFSNGVKDAAVAYEYTTDDGATWNWMTLGAAASTMSGGSDPKIDGNEIKDVLSADCVSNIVTVTWDSARDLAVGSVYNVRIRATIKDGVHNAVIAEVPLKGGELDFVQPTVTLKSDTPTPFNAAKAPMVVNVKFSKSVTGFAKGSLDVGNGTASVSGSGDAYAVTVTPNGDGAVTVQVLADKVVDKFGNKNKASTVLSRTYDTTAPVIQPIEGEPGEMVVTNGTEYAFTANASDESAPLKYHWTTNGVSVADNTTSQQAGEDALEGTNVVTVCAEDAAGNSSTNVIRTWVVDTIAPTEPEIAGKPAPITNVPAFSMTASSVDATRLTYHWTFNDEDFTGVTLAKTAREGENAVRVYATDEAGNVSPTNNYSWTLDTQKPANLKLDGEPQEGVVTNGTDFAFTASASDATALSFHWTTNGVQVADYTAAELSGTAIEGTNTVSVYAKDAAGNTCDPSNRTWVVDTIAPTMPEISGKPAALTNKTAFSMTASSADATRLTFWWSLNGAAGVRALPDEAFERDGLADGDYTVSVYAMDEAGNVSPTNSWSWTVDTIAPTDPVITGTPEKDAITNVKAYGLTAASTDEHLITYHWTLGARKAAVTNFVGTAEDGDGTYVARVYATDAAGNVSGTTTWTWTLDTTAPLAPVISGTPTNGSVTNEPNFDLTAVAIDVNRVTYHWLTNGVAAVDVTNFVGRVDEEGLFEVKCYATDIAGNVSETNDWSWTLDQTPPTKPGITGTPKDGVITNVEAYDLTAASTDEHLITYHWTLGEKKETVTNFVGSVTSSGEYTDFTAFVYATDEAGNVSETSSISWRLDTKRPSVTLTSTASGHFNRKAAPMEVTATFSEEVTNFTYECVTVQTGTVSNKVETVEEKKVFKFWVYPEHYGVPTFIDEETVSVSIDANKVWDYAGNGNEASRNEQGEQAPLTRVYDTKSPIVTLSSETPDNFNASFVPLKVTIGVTGKGVTELAQESIVITNGVVAKFEKTEEKQGDDGVITEKIYALEVTPTKEALITVVVPESVLTNMTGNTNPASEPPVRKTYDNTAPQNLAINGEPEQNKVTAATTFDFEATADDLTALKFHWTLNGVAVTDNETSKYSGTVEKGTNWVTVSATDAAGNTCAEVKRTWVVDFEPPKNLTLFGTPGVMGEIVVTNGTDFAYTASATDDTKITYHWMTNGVEVSGNVSTDLVGTASEGTNTVAVYATDEADNVSVTNTIVWVVDTIKPTVPVISGSPADGAFTQEQGYSYTAESEDATILTYFWTLNAGEETEKAAGEAFAGSGLADGGYTVSVYAKDEAGNKSVATNWTWTVDTTKPTDLRVWGLPISDEKIVVTNGNDFAFEASATDATALKYHWATNGVAVADCTASKFAGQVAEGTNTVTVFATDAAGNFCDSVERVWVVDTIAPTVPVIGGSPADAAFTQQTDYSFTAESEDATILTYFWTLNGGKETEKAAGEAFAGSGLADGGYTVSVYAKDEAGNKSVATNWTWTVDTTKPTDLRVWGLPISDEKIVVTNGNDFAFEASATDANALRFHWATNGVAVTDITSSNFVGKVGEGTNTVSVYAEDAAGNACDPITRIWVVDTIAPTVPVISGSPADGAFTQQTDYSYTAESEDATILTYFWTLNAGEETEKAAGEAFAGSGLADGGYVVSVYAQDEAGNKSVATNWTWTVDTAKPTDLRVWGLPISDEKIVVTNGNDFAFEASATDVNALRFHWATNGVAVADCTASKFVGQVAEGTNTVSVYAEDTAGNVCDPITRVWVVDTIAPTVPVISGSPADGAFTQEQGYSYMAESEDATILTYFWTLNGGKETEKAAGEAFAGSGLADGGYTVTVYAKDEAGNKSDATNWTWTVDTTKPTDLRVWGLPISDEKIVVTNGNDFAFEASATDVNALRFHWATNGVAVADCTASKFVGQVAEGTNTVSVYAEDAAGNVCEPVERVWVVDTIAPTVPVISGSPADGAFTQEQGYSYTAESEDATILTYFWTLNAGEETEKTAGEAFAGSALADGGYTVSVYATDEAGNKSDATNWTWTVDTTKPTDLRVWGLPISEDPEVIVLTNGCDFAFEASATDATALTFHWATNGVPADCTASNFVGQVSEGTNTVCVYAEDAAGNVCDPINRTWVVDITPPSNVVFTTELSADKVINLADVTPKGFKVMVKFSEDVVGFTAASVAITNGNGTVTAVETNSAASYTVWVMPAGDGLVPLQIAAGAVKDLAGNGNVAPDVLERMCDITPPTVKISSNIKKDLFGPNDLIGNPFTVTVEFSELVTNFTASSVTVSNCTVQSVSPSAGVATIYTVVIEPPDHDDVIAISIADSAVTDLAGNGNTASDVLTRKYDKTKPTKPVITGTPANGSTTGDSAYALSASSQDFSAVTYFWSIDGGKSWRQVTDFMGVVVAEGTYTVQVYARDAVLRKSDVATWSWTYKSGVTPEGVSFGDSVQLKITDVSVTNVEFTAVDFQPGAESTFALRKFELIDSQETSREITDLRMQFIVGTNLLDGIRWPVKVESFAGYTNGTLTVRMLGDKTTDENTGKPFESFFIFGVDNKEK